MVDVSTQHLCQYHVNENVIEQKDQYKFIVSDPE